MDQYPHRILHDHKYQSRGDFDFDTSSTKRTSVISDGSTLVASSIAGSDKKRLQKTSKSSSISLKPIKEDCEVRVADGPPKKRHWIWLITILCFVPAILIPVLVTMLHKKNGGVSGPSALQTTTVVVSQATTKTLTQSGITVTTTQTQTLVAVTTLLSFSQTTRPSPTQAPIEGFSSYGWDNGNIQLFYGDVSGNILSVQSIQDVWSEPSVITSDAISGTTISISIIYMESYTEWFGNAGNVLWRVIYIDGNNILQEKRKLLTFGASGYSESAEINNLAGSSGWVDGSLGSYGYKASSTLYQESCTWSGTYNATESTPNAYLYFDSAFGGMQNLGWFYDDTWEILYDLPSAVSGANKAIECTPTDNALVDVWVVNEGQLQQWSYNGQITGSTWNQGFSYIGPIFPNTSLWGGVNQYGFTELYFQATNNSIMQLSTWSETPSTTFSSLVEVGVGSPGTRINGAGNSIFFQNGSDLLQQLMVIDYNTNQTIPISGGVQVLSVVALGDCVSRGSLVSNFAFGSVFYTGSVVAFVIQTC